MRAPLGTKMAGHYRSRIDSTHVRALKRLLARLLKWVDILPRKPRPVFRERFSLEHCMTLRNRTSQSFESVLDCLEDFSKPLRLESVSANFISRWRVHLVKIGVSDSTRATYLRTLKATLNWAASVGLLSSVPNFPKEKRKDSGRHRGRALTAAEVQTN